jgi:hypothetical protein
MSAYKDRVAHTKLLWYSKRQHYFNKELSNMFVSYVLCTEDLSAAAKYLAKSNPELREQFTRAQSSFVSVFVIIAVVFSYVFFRAYSLLAFAGFAVALVGSFFLFRYYIYSDYVKRFTKVTTNGSEQFQRSITLQLHETGIESVSDLGTGQLYWSSVQKIDVDAQYIYIMLPSANVVVIPISAFGNEADRAAFVSYIQEKVANNNDSKDGME